MSEVVEDGGRPALRVARKEVLGHYALSEMGKHHFNRERLREVLADLSEQELSTLVAVLSRHRRNAVERVLAEPGTWELEDVDIGKILLTRINDEVNPLLERNGFELESIALDEEICAHREFQSGGRSIEDDKTIGVQEGTMVRIYDGMHRLIRMACDNRDQFPIYVRKPSR